MKFRRKDKKELKAQEAEDRFVCEVLHEIRTAIHGISGMAELLKGTELTAAQSEQLDTIAVLADDIRRFCSDVLHYQLTRDPTFALEIAPCNLRQRLGQLAQSIQAEAHQRKLVVMVNFDLLPSVVWCDGTRIVQIFHNLIQNILVHAEGQLMSLSVDKVERQGDSYVLFCCVQDGGKGIAKDRADTLFSPAIKRSANSKGSGLGLAVCAQLVRAMNGTISVKSQVGIGTRIYFELRVGAVER